MQMAGGVWTMDLSGTIPPGGRWHVPEVKVELTGPTRHVGRAVRRDAELPATRPAGVARAR
jgi:hypothetical protein